MGTEIDRRSLLLFGAAAAIAPSLPLSRGVTVTIAITGIETTLEAIGTLIDTGVGDMYYSLANGLVYVKAEDNVWREAADIS